MKKVVGLSFLLLFFLNSCSNFLIGSVGKEKIEEAVKYEKSESFIINVKPEKVEMGSVSGSSEKNCQRNR